MHSHDTALIENGVVHQVWRNCHEDDAEHPSLTGDWVMFPAGEVVCGQLWDGKTLTNPPPDILPVRQQPGPNQPAIAHAALPPVDLAPIHDALELFAQEIANLKAAPAVTPVGHNAPTDTRLQDAMMAELMALKAANEAMQKQIAAHTATFQALGDIDLAKPQ